MRRALPVLLLLLAACTRPPREQRESFPPDTQLERVTLQSYRGAETRVEVTAPTLALRRDSTDFELVDASVRLPAEGLSAQAPHVVGNLNAAVLEGTGGVTFEGRDGVTGRAERATFDRALGAQGGVVSDAGVRLEHPRFTLEATGFQVDFADERATFEQPVTRSR